MKQYLVRICSLIIFCLCLPGITKDVIGQPIPNGNFEDWIIGGGPDLWYTNNIYPPPLECIQIYPDFQAYNGNICALGLVDSCSELAVLLPPLLQSFEINLAVRPEALHGFYKYFPIGEDLFVANVDIYSNGEIIGKGILESKQLVSDFTEFIININYSNNDSPDIGIIKFTIDSSLVDNKLHQGSKWHIDYLVWGPLSDVNDDEIYTPNTFSLSQNYPNPFNPSTVISYQLPVGSNVTLKVYDVLGNGIATLFNEYKPAGRYEVEFAAKGGYASGVYFYQLKTGEYLNTKKMILLK